jgi:hypothetical protein
VVSKHYYDGFNGTVLDEALRARGVTTLAVTGTMTDIRVLATVIGGFNREYRLVVVEDAVATLWPEIQRVNPRYRPPGLRPRAVGQGVGRRAGPLVTTRRSVLRSTP